jgi:antitoxin StbD
MQRFEASASVSVSDLKKNPAAILNKAQDETVAILYNNRIMAYMVAAQKYEAILDRLDDFHLAELLKSRSMLRAILASPLSATS